VDRDAMRAFVSRDWQGAAESKAEYWAARFRENPQSTWDAAQALLAHVRRIRPSFPSDELRDADFRDHLTLRSRLDRAAHAFANR
jgi:hypothetical protein